MLSNNNAIATIAVKDMAAARKFYGDTLGLEKTDMSDEEVTTYKSGDSHVLVYQSKFAGGYQATVATWIVRNDLEDIIATLKERGVAFEHYDMPGTVREGDIHISDGMKVAWFKDPDGNIICLVNE